MLSAGLLIEDSDANLQWLLMQAPMYTYQWNRDEMLNLLMGQAAVMRYHTSVDHCEMWVKMQISRSRGDVCYFIMLTVILYMRAAP